MTEVLPVPQIPSIHDRDVFRAALLPHQRRLRLARTFMDMDVSWSGQEAWAFRQLLLGMVDFLDGEAPQRLPAARSRIDRAMGDPEQDHAAAIRRRNGTGFRGVIEGVLGILDQGTWPGHRSIFKGSGVPALHNLVDDLARRSLDDAPKRIAELEDLADYLEGAADGAS